MSGTQLDRFETKKLRNNAGGLHGSFFAIATFTGDVRVYEVDRGKSGKGEIKGVQRAMDISTSCEVSVFCFDMTEKDYCQKQ